MKVVQMDTRITCTVFCKRHRRIKGMRKFECLTSAQRKYLETHKQYSTELNAWVCYTIVSVWWSSLPSSFFFFFASRRGQKPQIQHTKFPSHEITYTEREYNNACGVDFGRILYTISVWTVNICANRISTGHYTWIVHGSGTYSVFIECYISKYFSKWYSLNWFTLVQCSMERMVRMVNIIYMMKY